LEDRLRVGYEVEPQALAAQVPNLILQPIVENAIKHGVGQSFGPVQIVVAARSVGGRLHLQIKDNGESLPDGPQDRKEGFGLTNTRARLKSAYGADCRFELTRAADGWTAATLDVPFVAAADGAHALAER
jgi:two-component system, LytTR family, sensor kinase